MTRENNRHRAFLTFIGKLVDVPAGLSKEDLFSFRSMASRDYPSLVPLIDNCILLAERAESDVVPRPGAREGERTRLGTGKGRGKRNGSIEQMHLFDLLRDKRLFPLNSDLASFAGRVLPAMSRHRFDKMSRGDIASRIIEYVEARDPSARDELAASMRDALSSGSAKPSEQRSFFSRWEKIIKGIEL